MKKTQRQQWQQRQQRQQRQRQWQMKMTRRSTWGHIQVVSCSVLSHPVATRGCCTKLRQPNGMCTYTHTPMHTHTHSHKTHSPLYLLSHCIPPSASQQRRRRRLLFGFEACGKCKNLSIFVCVCRVLNVKESRGKGTGKGTPRGATEGGSETGN